MAGLGTGRYNLPMSGSVRDQLKGLPHVVVRRMGTRDGFFTAGRMFALLGEATVWLRLPVPVARAEVERGHAAIGAVIPAALGWVAVDLSSTQATELPELALAAHQAVRSFSRRSGSVPRRRRTRPVS